MKKSLVSFCKNIKFYYYSKNGIVTTLVFDQINRMASHFRNYNYLINKENRSS